MQSSSSDGTTTVSRRLHISGGSLKRKWEPFIDDSGEGVLSLVWQNKDRFAQYIGYANLGGDHESRPKLFIGHLGCIRNERHRDDMLIVARRSDGMCQSVTADMLKTLPFTDIPRMVEVELPELT